MTKITGSNRPGQNRWGWLAAALQRRIRLPIRRVHLLGSGLAIRRVWLAMQPATCRHPPGRSPDLEA
jgi:hypothetical protein